MDSQIKSLEQRFTDFSENLKEAVRLHGEAQTKQNEMYQKNFADRLDALSQTLTYIQSRVDVIATKEDVSDLEVRLRTLEMEFKLLQGDKQAGDDNRSIWILVGLTLLSTFLGLLSNLATYIMQ